jgi:zinc protease
MRRVMLLLAILWAAAPCGAVERTLDNGLRVVLIPHRANPMVASAVIVGAGVVDEPQEASGASHFLEHLLFNGTETRTQRQLYDDVDRLGAYNNATTREDHTLFTLLVAKEHAEQGLAIQADMLFHSTIPEENFEKERKIVLEELARDRSDPSYDLEAAFRAMAFSGTPIARPVLGTEASLGAITRPEVVRYYKARYVPANMTLVVMGDFDIDAMAAAVQRTFGLAPALATPIRPAAAWPKAPKDNVELAPADALSLRLMAAFPLQAAPWDKTAAAAEALLSAASEGKDSPLALALARRGVKASASTLSLERRAAPWTTVLFDAELEKGSDPSAALDALTDAIRATRPGGGARGRVAGVLTKITSDAVIARDQIQYFAMLRSSSILGSPKGAVEDDSRDTTLSSEDLDAASSRLIASLPALRARVAGPGLTAKRVSFTPAPEAGGKMETASPLRAGALLNGLRYVVGTSSDSDVFALHLGFAPRAASEPEGRDGITDLLHRMMARGTIVHGPAALDDRLSRLGARVKAVDDPSVPFDDYYTTPEFSWLRLEVPVANWREAVGLVAEMVRFPSLTDEALSEARHDVLDRISRRDGSPRELAARKLDALLAPGHPLTRPVYGTTDSIHAVTLDELKTFHAAFATGRRTIASVVGPVPGDEVVRALDEDFGPLPAGEPPVAVAPVPLSHQSATDTANLGKSQAYLAMGTVLDVPASDRAALTVAVAMLSDRLAFTLRETKGLAYTIGASMRPWGGRTRFDVTMGTRAENLDQARTGIVDGVRSFREAAPAQADVDRAVNVARGAALMRRMMRISLAYEAGLEAMRGREPGDERRFVDSLRSVRADDVKRVAATYLDPDRLSVVVVR